MPNNHLPGNIHFKGRARGCLPYGCRKSSMAWRLQITKLPHGSSSVFLPAPLIPKTLVCFPAYAQGLHKLGIFTTCGAKNAMLHGNAALRFFLHSVSKQKSTRCQYLCSPAKPPAALRFLLHDAWLICMPFAKICTVRPITSFPRSRQPVALAAKSLNSSLIRFLGERRQAIAMKNCNRFRLAHGSRLFYHATPYCLQKFEIVFNYFISGIDALCLIIGINGKPE